MTDFTRPQTVDAAELVFPAGVSRLMPDYETVPEDFKRFSGNEWVDLVGEWFFRGLPETVTFHPKPNINAEEAFRHVSAVLGSFEPKHEHKTAACAYLCSLWFEKVEGWKRDR